MILPQALTARLGVALLRRWRDRVSQPVATGKQSATSINLFDNNGRLGRLNFEATQCRPSTVGSGHWTGPLQVSGFQRMQCGGCRCSRGPFRVRLLVGVRAGGSGSGPGGRVQVQVDRPSPLGGRRPGGPGARARRGRACKGAALNSTQYRPCWPTDPQDLPPGLGHSRSLTRTQRHAACSEVDPGPPSQIETQAT
jgi:hypothetical protein